MDPRLLKAAQHGEVASLCALLDEDPLILEKSAIAPTTETPLHVAALAGKADFVHKIILQKPSFAWELNHDGLNPLHIASAAGHNDVVLELLKLDPKLCLEEDKQGLIPLHYAAMKGRVSVIKDLLKHCPESVKVRTSQDQTVLHLAVKNCQFEAFKTLVETLEGDNVEDLVDAKDKDGNTVWQMAVSSKQLKVVQYLKSHTKVGMNSIKIYFDKLQEGTDTMPPPEQTTQTPNRQINPTNEKAPLLSEDMLLIVASLIATITFQTGITRPESFSKDDFDIFKKCKGVSFFKILFYNNGPCYDALTLFNSLVLNTAAFYVATFLFFLRNSSYTPFLVTTGFIFMFNAYILRLTVIYPRGTIYLMYPYSLIVLILYLILYKVFILDIFPIIQMTKRYEEIIGIMNTLTTKLQGVTQWYKRRVEWVVATSNI